MVGILPNLFWNKKGAKNVEKGRDFYLRSWGHTL